VSPGPAQAAHVAVKRIDKMQTGCCVFIMSLMQARAVPTLAHEGKRARAAWKTRKACSVTRRAAHSLRIQDAGQAYKLAPGGVDRARCALSHRTGSGRLVSACGLVGSWYLEVERRTVTPRQFEAEGSCVSPNQRHLKFWS